jgi:hypothetical protein
MAADVRPYLVPSKDTVTWGQIELLEGDAWAALPESVEGWDSGTDLRVRRRVQIDVARLRDEAGLDARAVAVTLSWTSSTTSMTEAARPVLLTIDGVAAIETLIAGDRVSGTLELRTTLSVIRPSGDSPPGVARIPGSVLAEQTQRVSLENSGAMFPVAEIDFARTRLSADASWYLETTTELLAPFFGTFRLLINKRDAELSGAVARGAKDKRQQALLDELETGVASLLLELAVHLREDLSERELWPPDSVGDVLLRTLTTSDLAAERAPSAHDLADFRSRLAGSVRRAGTGRRFV